MNERRSTLISVVLWFQNNEFQSWTLIIIEAHLDLDLFLVPLTCCHLLELFPPLSPWHSPLNISKAPQSYPILSWAHSLPLCGPASHLASNDLYFLACTRLCSPLPHCPRVSPCDQCHMAEVRYVTSDISFKNPAASILETLSCGHFLPFRYLMGGRVGAMRKQATVLLWAALWRGSCCKELKPPVNN